MAPIFRCSAQIGSVSGMFIRKRDSETPSLTHARNGNPWNVHLLCLPARTAFQSYIADACSIPLLQVVDDASKPLRGKGGDVQSRLFKRSRLHKKHVSCRNSLFSASAATATVRVSESCDLGPVHGV